MTTKETLNLEKQKEVPSNNEIMEAGKEDGRKIAEAIKSNPLIANNFSSTGSEIVNNINFNKSIEALQNSENLKDDNGKSVVEDILENLKSGNRKEALTIAYDFLQNVLGGSTDSNGKHTFWFEGENKEIKNIINNVPNEKSKEENAVRDINSSIERTSGTKKKLGLAYALSHIQNRIQLHNPAIQSLVDEKPTNQEKNIALMAQSVQPGDIIAINKSEKKPGDNLLTDLKKGDIDSSHVMMVTKVDKAKGTVTFMHSTMDKISQPGQKGVEQEIDLTTYAQRQGKLAIAILKPPVSEDNRKEYINNVLSKDGKPYDSLSAASQGVTKTNLMNNNDKYNCVELIAESFIPAKKRAHPADMIQELTPKYVTIAGEKAEYIQTKI